MKDEVVKKLEDLTDLLKKDLITREEYEILKQRLIYPSIFNATLSHIDRKSEQNDPPRENLASDENATQAQKSATTWAASSYFVVIAIIVLGGIALISYFSN